MSKESNKCKNCGGTLCFNPNGANVKCTKCGDVSGIEISTDYAKHEIDIAQQITNENTITVKSMHCNTCGASFKSETATMSGTCEYCGSNLVVDDDDESGFKPDGVVPFEFDINTAKEKFKEGIKKRHFLPFGFKKKLPSTTIDNIYMPSFNFNCTSDNNYKARLVDIDTDKDGNTSRSYRTVQGAKIVDSKNLTVECSSRINLKNFDKLKPYNFDKCYKFNKNFILGYSVEYYNRSLEEVRNLAKAMIDEDIKTSILSKYYYDELDYYHVDTKYIKTDYSHILLPMYRVAYKYRKKDYITYMNGQTGKVRYRVPRSGAKIAILITSIIAAVAGVVVLLQCL